MKGRRKRGRKGTSNQLSIWLAVERERDRERETVFTYAKSLNIMYTRKHIVQKGRLADWIIPTPSLPDHE